MAERRPPTALQGGLWLAGVVFYGAYAQAQPFVFGDEGYLYYLAHAVAQGQAPLRDFHLQSYMPGLFYAFAGPASLAGRSVDLLRLAMVPWLALTPVLALRCAWRLCPPPFAVAAALVLLLVPGPWTKFYVPGLSLLVLDAALDLADAPALRPAVRAGAAVGLSLGIRIDVTVVGAAVLALALVLGPPRARPRRAATCLAGATLAWAPFAALMAAQGVLADHLRQLAEFLPEMARRAGAGLQLARPPLGATEPFSILFHGSIAVLLAFAWATATTRDREERRPRLLVLAWAVASTPPYLWERPDMPHLTQRGFCFVLPLAALAHDAWRARGNPSWRSRVAVLATALGCIGLITTYLAVTLRDAQGGSAGVLWRPHRRVTLSNGVSYTAAPNAVAPELLERVLAGTHGDEPVGALPFLPGVNFLTDRPLPGRYVFLVPHTVNAPDVEPSYASELVRARYIVYSPGQTTTGTPRGLLPAYAPRVTALLHERYGMEMEIGDYRLLRRRDDERRGP